MLKPSALPRLAAPLWASVGIAERCSVGAGGDPGGDGDEVAAQGGPPGVRVPGGGGCTGRPQEVERDRGEEILGHVSGVPAEGFSTQT